MYVSALPRINMRSVLMCKLNAIIFFSQLFTNVIFLCSLAHVFD